MWLARLEIPQDPMNIIEDAPTQHQTRATPTTIHVVLILQAWYVYTMLFDDAFHNYYDSIRLTRLNTLFLVTPNQ